MGLSLADNIESNTGYIITGPALTTLLLLKGSLTCHPFFLESHVMQIAFLLVQLSLFQT